ncbi:DUF4221 family protein [Algoriphagus zhangzhouensis]|uniref:DUF4221 domain-containing protein n=1 Tax=Algoriphagus zhangzhouensis TaxID=1073327 RepID=A0A1M7ZB17_9BACT|nr:DUF4221 family protein [Algoriphagus zhangzhouensis]TDY46924.1 uncharacterized protein DUF4221 [Algoriphagus zhangzhouensis]SHO62117.1 protein of unknown function [Algoriphagus zhangzhouensis]
MKKLLLLSSLAILAACSGKESENRESKNVLENFSFSVDTVVVDPGEEIINLAYGARLASTDESKTFYYLLDGNAGIVNKVNLDELKLVEMIPFEKEGPNGIGTSFHSSAIVLPGEEFLFTSFRNSGIFSKDGEKLKDLGLKPDEIEIEGLDDNQKMNLNNQLTLTKNQITAFSLPSNFMQGTRKLVKIDLKESTGEVLSIPALDIIGKYNIILQSEEAVSVYAESINIQEIGDALYISGQTTNKIYKFNFSTDSLSLLEFDFSIVPNEKEIPIQNTVSSQEEFDAQMDKALTQISFEKLIFDVSTNRFYRFGRIYEPKKEGEERYTKSKIFLFAFDDQLNLIGETEIPELDQVPTFPFFKDGKLWSYVNVEDELGFAVFTFNF